MICTRSHSSGAQDTSWGLIPSHISVDVAKMLGDSLTVSTDVKGPRVACQLPESGSPEALTVRLYRLGTVGRTPTGPCGRQLCTPGPLGSPQAEGWEGQFHTARAPEGIICHRGANMQLGGASGRRCPARVPAALVPRGKEGGARPLALTVTCPFLCPAATSPCKILKCNSEFWSATAGSHSPASDDAPEFCAALRTYALCTRRTARTCRGDLAYHSAVHGIEDLMSQYNCSKDGPTSQPRLRTLPPPGDSQERSDSPEICHYEKSFHKHSAAPNYTHCGLFGDPHLRTFTDRFQTCKVQGAWPLIDNNYLNVQVTNTPVLPGSAATATSKVRGEAEARAAPLSPGPRPRHRLHPAPQSYFQ